MSKVNQVSSHTEAFKGYSTQDRDVVKQIKADLESQGMVCTTADVIKAVEPSLTTPDHLKAV